MALINYLIPIHFADRVLEDALAEQLRRLGIRRPLIVTDGTGADDEPLARTLDALPPECRATVLPIDPFLRQKTAALDIRAAYAADSCDGYIGLGGQAALDLARRAAHEVRFGPPRTAAVLPVRPGVVAIPTSTTCLGLQPVMPRDGRAGKAETLLPEALLPEALLPDVILCDPTLTLGQSEAATAAAGMDTLTHCIEAYLGTTWNPPADGMALDGVRRACTSLDRAVHHGNDLAARREMMAAALNAGLAAQKGLGAVEALSHALEVEIGRSAPHGSLHAALLPAVLVFNAPAINGRMSVLRDTLHVLRDEDVASTLSALGARIRLPTNLAALQLDDALRLRVAQRAVEHPANRTNPRHATSADYVRMLAHAN